MLDKPRYNIAIGFLENTGGSRIEAKFRTPEGAGSKYLGHINPASSKQDGLWVEPNPLDTFAPGTYTINYTATDLAGNTSTATRTVEVSEAIQPPVLTLEGRPIIKHPVGTDFTDPGVKLTGPAGEDLSAELPKVVVTGTVDAAGGVRMSGDKTPEGQPTTAILMTGKITGISAAKNLTDGKVSYPTLGDQTTKWTAQCISGCG